eukprot:CAMPEP_0205824678 /NCGR_PEP_ID=MMETSP0206-20130828/22132_1 /ASSEMBLY_ACC=CAM_ASM_000279 /TAXON_ID=36767 /ORGANISM="Euplotes focardii, Strain TN1" /LENGTH=184 /DNA_ID=CAMNT_0053123019 /DNA_START=16 /DNA_END=567 /DNA_ORIENTATION=+
MIKTVSFLLAFLAIVVFADPEAPRWPTKFTEEFTETFTYPVFGKFHTKGTFYYDAGSNRYRVEREDGRADRYCGLNGLKFLSKQPCDHYVDEHGDRYLHYPKKNECCFCCAAEHGCGILRSDWQSGATFDGEVEYNGFQAYKWDKKGLQSNLYIETISDNPLNRVMLNMDQQPNDNQIFDPLTW